MPQINESTLNFTTTAMPRAEVLATTYDSFSKNLRGLDFKKITLFINIDRFPGDDDDTKRHEVADVARSYFGKVIVNMPQTSNFAAAVKWCFSRVEAPFNFHLEDDWQLLSEIKVSTLTRLFIPPHIQQVALRSRENVRQDFWLCPSVIRGNFCRQMAAKMRITENPEVEIRHIKNWEKVYGESSFVYFPFDFKNLIVQDIGRSWIKSTTFQRKGTHFTSWTIQNTKE